MTRSAVGSLSLRRAALIAGLGLLTMTLCAPFAFFRFIPQVVVADDAVATLQNLRTAGTPFLFGVFLLFITYVMDILVAWALYWFLRPGQQALSQLVAWMRVLYTALAFIGLMAYFQAYDAANSSRFAEAVGLSAVQSEVASRLLAASTTTRVALLFFGVHLLALALLIWRSAHVPRWIGVAVALAGSSYVVMHTAEFFAPDLSLGWLMILALGELLLMAWLLIKGARLADPEPLRQ